MDALTEYLGTLTVGQRAGLGVAAFLFLFAVLVAVTSLFIAFRRALLLWLVVLAAIVAFALLMPIDTEDLRADPRPEPDFESAVARFEAAREANTVPLNPLCEPQLLTHGERTEKAVVLLHGVSSCPQAFVDFAPQVHALGHNVLVARMPYNGFADRATDALGNITAEVLADFGDESVDIAAGLGEEVIVVGISAGGTVAAWMGQNREEVSRAVLLAPFFGLADFGPRINLALMRAMLLLPDVPIWKDPVLRERFVGMPHAYQRQSTRATGEIMRLALAVYRQAVEAPPAAPEAAFVANEADTAVSTGVMAVIAGVWIQGGMRVMGYKFDAEHGLGHEIVDPLEPGANPEITYPVILGMIEDPDSVATIGR